MSRPWAQAPAWAERAPAYNGPRVVTRRISVGFWEGREAGPPGPGPRCTAQAHRVPGMPASQDGNLPMASPPSYHCVRARGATGGPKEPQEAPGFLSLRDTYPRVGRAAGGTWVALYVA